MSSPSTPSLAASGLGPARPKWSRSCCHLSSLLIAHPSGSAALRINQTCNPNDKCQVNNRKLTRGPLMSTILRPRANRISEGAKFKSSRSLIIVVVGRATRRRRRSCGWRSCLIAIRLPEMRPANEPAAFIALEKVRTNTKRNQILLFLFFSNLPNSSPILFLRPHDPFSFFFFFLFSILLQRRQSSFLPFGLLQRELAS